MSFNPDLTSATTMAEPEFVKGTCTTMCPQEEVLMRDREGMVHFLEMPKLCPRQSYYGNNVIEYADPDRIVKCYRRPAPGVNLNQPHLIRPPHVLQSTLHYLLTEVVLDKRIPMGKVYEFLDDRLRAIRQDIILQQPPPSECIPILEPIVRFYAFAAYRHCEDKGDQFDPVLNHGSLLSCLKCLMIMYDSEDHVSEDRSEMEALYLIINLGHTEALIRSLTLPKHIRHGIVLDAEKLSLSWCLGNYYAVCKSVETLPLILAISLVGTQLAHIRRFTLRIMSSAYSSRNSSFPLSELVKLLLYDSIESAVQDCEDCGISIEFGQIRFLKTSFKENPNSQVGIKKIVSIDKKIMALTVPELLLHLSPC